MRSAICIALLIVCVSAGSPWGQSGAGSSPGTSSKSRRQLLQPRRVGQLMMTGSMYLEAPFAATTNVTSIVAGGYNRAAILKNGTAVVWGSYLDADTLSGPVYFVTTASPVRQVAVGYYYTLVLLANGTVLKVPTGDGKPLPSELRTGVVGVAIGAYTSVAIRQSGSLFVWDTPDKSIRAQLSALTGVKNVSIGYSTNEDDKLDTIMVLFENRTIRVFSQDSQFGQLVVPKSASAGVTAVAAGVKHCLALVNGAVVAWGEVPGKQVPGKAKKGIAAIVAGQEHSLALTATGEVVCWGGPGACRGLDSLTTPVRGIAASDGFSAVVGTDLRVKTWDGPEYGDYLYEVPGELMTARITAIAAGQDHALAIRDGDDGASGGVVGFGSNRWGQVNVPPAALQPKAVKVVAAGAFHSLALLNTGKVVSWGKPLAWVPANLVGAVDIAAGRDVSCVLFSSANVECFGNTTRLKLNLIQGVAVTKVALQRLNALALTAQGGLISFGVWSNANLPEASKSNVVDVAASRDSGLVLLSNGSMIRFSMRDSSSSVVPQPPCKRVSRVSAGSDVFMIVCEDGQAVVLDSVTAKNKSYSQVLQAVGGVDFNLFLIRAQQAEPELSPSPPLAPVTTYRDGSPTLSTNAIGPASSTQSQIGLGRPEQHESGPSNSKTAVVGGAVGGSVGALLVAALLAAAAWRVRLRKRKLDTLGDGTNPASKDWADQKNQYVMRAGNTKPEELNLIGVGKGELYARTTAHEYTWSSVSAASPHLVPVEAGVNDLALDLLVDDSEAAIDGSQAVKLTQAELKQQIFLLQDGLLGKGATAVAFKALWPSRFGPNGVVAVKMLKDGHEADMATLQSFAYEASVLATTRHPNVVTMYGYCLEPPTVCLILEVMQHSLKDMLYSHATPQGTSTAHSQPRAVSSHHSGARAHLLPIPEPAPSCASLDDALEDVTPCIQITLAEDPRPSTPSEARTSAVRSSDAQTQPLKEKSSSLALSTLDNLDPPLSVARVLEISRDIAAGLAYLHDTPLDGASPLEHEGVQALQSGRYRNGSSRRVSEIVADLEDRGSPRYSDAGMRPGRIVHRDLKPANVLLNSLGQAKVSDFGLAREHHQSSIHTERVGAGTLPYQAPEILMSSYGTSYLPMTNKVDIYSCAMIMYEMLARQMPWKGLGEMAVLAAVTGSRRPELPASPSNDGAGRVMPPPEVLAQMPASLGALPELTSIIRACWHQRYHKRPSAAELHAQLTRLLQE